jgi:hypothetical protein
LNAIRNLNEYELNGRKLRVNFSNSSHLEALATKLGMDMNQHQHQREIQKMQAQHELQAARAAAMASKNVVTSKTAQQVSATGGTSAVADALKAMTKAEMYDVVAKLKEIADSNPDEARRIISGHPQLPEALLFCMSKLDMVQTSLPNADLIATMPVAIPVASSLPAPVPNMQPSAMAVSRPADPRSRPADPRAAMATTASSAGTAVGTSAAMDPRKDPRKSDSHGLITDPRSSTVPPSTISSAPLPVVDPRAQMMAQVSLPPPPPPPPPISMQYGGGGMLMPPPPPPPPMAMSGMPQLDPSLVQQVMSLTPQQIAQLPPEKQQGIMALRNQITGAGR